MSGLLFFIYLFIYIFIYLLLFIYLFIYLLTTYLLTYLFIYLFIYYTYLPVCVRHRPRVAVHIIYHIARAPTHVVVVILNGRSM